MLYNDYGRTHLTMEIEQLKKISMQYFKKSTTSVEHERLWINYFKLRPNWNTRALSYPRALRLVVAFLTVLAAYIFLRFFDHRIQTNPFLFFISSVMFSSWFGGLRSGLAATVLSAIAIDYFFLPPLYQLFPFSKQQFSQLILFILEGSFISVLSHSMHMALFKAEVHASQFKKNEENLNLLFDTISDYAISTFDVDGYIKKWSDGAKQITGYKKEDVFNKHFSILYKSDLIASGIPWQLLKDAYKKGHIENEQWRMRKDGTVYWANTIITAIRGIDDSVTGFVEITRDRTQKKEIEKRKDEFISVASHELKNPLTSLIIFTEMLKKETTKVKVPKINFYITKINSQIMRLNTLITDLLDVSRIQENKIELRKELFNINTLVKDCIEEIQPTSKTHTIIKKGKANSFVYADKERIRQVLINLLSNAIKYSPKSNQIFVYIRTFKDKVTIGVEDEGLGISPEYINSIFKRFVREETHSIPGLGLGLYISYEIIKKHGEKMWVESIKGKGSTFYFNLSIKKGKT